MNACLQFDAPGTGGPADVPEYDGPSIDELVEQKIADKVFVQAWASDIPQDVYACLLAGDDLTFRHRFFFELRRLAENEARDEYETQFAEWSKSL